MTRGRFVLFALAPLLLATCDKPASTSTPPELAAADPSTDPPSDPAGDPAADDATDPPADDGASEAPGPPTAEDEGDGAAAEGDGDEGDDTTEAPPTEPATKPAKPTAKLELPKAMNTSIKASCGKDPGVGTKLKGFKLPSTESGKTVSNGTYRGRVMLVNFWGTWCKPCLKELPKFAQLYRHYRKHGMTLLAIATDEDAAAVKDVLDKKKIAAKVAIAGEEYAGQYGAPEFPFSFVVDHRGVIQASYFGYEPDCMGKLEADIREQLEKRAAAGE